MYPNNKYLIPKKVKVISNVKLVSFSKFQPKITQIKQFLSYE